MASSDAAIPRTNCSADDLGSCTGAARAPHCCSKIIIKNLVGEWLAWALACGAREQRKLLAQKENVLVLGEWMGFFPAQLSYYRVHFVSRIIILLQRTKHFRYKLAEISFFIMFGQHLVEFMTLSLG